MIDTRDPHLNLLLLSAMVEQLEDHLASDDLLHQIVVQAPERTLQPKMTVGLMLDLMRALERQSGALDDEERTRLQELEATFGAVRARHGAAYGEKLRLELKSLLDTWRWFLDDCEEGEDACAEDYRSEVWVRTRVEDLFAEAEKVRLDVSDAWARAQELDAALRDLFQPGDYCGPTDQMADRPRGKFWWLYGRPAS